MNKLLVTLMLSSALLTPALASDRSVCLKSVWETLRSDLDACKDVEATLKNKCQTAAAKKSKTARAACPAEPKSTKVVKTNVKTQDTTSASKTSTNK